MLSARTCRPPCLVPMLESERIQHLTRCWGWEEVGRCGRGPPTWGYEPVDQRKKGFVSALNIRSGKSLSTRDARLRACAFRGGGRWPRAPDETPPASASTT